jgi:hypothetical protein
LEYIVAFILGEEELEVGFVVFNAANLIFVVDKVAQALESG